MSPVLALNLTPDVVATLGRMLAVALQLPDDAHVVDYLPANPWGDLAAFRAQVYFPLHGQAEPLEGANRLTRVILDPQEARVVRNVLEQLGESISGGVGWSKPPPADLGVVADVATRLR